MDPRHPFMDERHRGGCAYCGTKPDTRDHVPSRVLLDEPYPLNLPTVDACEDCNASFSRDEQYIACLIDAVVSGSAQPEEVRREKVKRLLADNVALAVTSSAYLHLLGWRRLTRRLADFIDRWPRVTGPEHAPTSSS